MISIELTERTITQEWDKEAQEHVQKVAERLIYVNPDAIEVIRGGSDAPEKYASHVRMRSGWDLFVVEAPGLVDALIKRSRNQLRGEEAWYQSNDPMRQQRS